MRKLRIAPVVFVVVVLLVLLILGCGDPQGISADKLEPLCVEWKAEIGGVEDIIALEDLVITYSTLLTYSPQWESENVVVCTDLKKGKKLWSTGGISFNCRNISLYKEQIVVLSEDGNVLFLDTRSGEILRKIDIYEGETLKSIEPGTSPDFYMVTGFTVCGEILVVVNEGGEIRAFNLTQGRRIWKTELPEGNLLNASSPVSGEGVVLYPGRDLYAYDLDTGEMIWISGKHAQECVIRDNSVFVLEIDSVSRIGLLDGEDIWSRGLRETLNGFVVADDKMLFAFSHLFEKKNLLAYGLNVDSGDIVWEQAVNDDIVSYGDQLVYNGVLYFTTIPGNIYAVDSSSGKGLAAYETGNTAAGTSVIQSSGKILSGGDLDFLFALEPVYTGI